MKSKYTDEERAERKRESRRKYEEANREKIIERHREYNSRPEVRARLREYYAKKRREAGIPKRPPKMTEEERIAKRNERNRLRAERLRREAGIPIKTRMSHEEKKRRARVWAAEYRKKNLAKVRERNRLREERVRRERGVPEKLKLPDADARRERKRELLRKWRSDHRDRYNAQVREYNHANQEKIRARGRKAYWEDPDKHRNCALISQLASDLNVARKDLPQELVQARLALVNVKRKVKELMR